MNTDPRESIHQLIQGNRFDEARTRCERWCRKQRDNPEAWFLLGSINARLGNTDAAIENLRRSLALNDRVALTHSNLGTVYLHSGRIPQARASFEQALALQPTLADARLGRARSLLAAGTPTEALPHFEQAVQAGTAVPPLLLEFAAACLAAGEQDRARELLQRARAAAPGDTGTQFQAGNLLFQLGDYAEALAQFTALADRHPEHLEIAVNRANTLARLGRHDTAVACYRQTLAAHPEVAAVHFNLANTLRDAGRGDEAADAYREALRCNPFMAGALNNLGLLLHEQGDNAAAVEYFRQAIDAAPAASDAYINLANLQRDTSATAQAITTLRQALQQLPELPALHGDLALLLLRSGNFGAGWEEYEWRLQIDAPGRRRFPLPTCPEQDPAGRTVLVAAEQGIGDEIMFASCYADLAATAGHVVIDCEPRLAPLFARSFPGTTIHGGRQTDGLDWLTEIPAPDCVIHAGSLPLRFRRRAADFPAHTGYLRADPARVEHWRRRYASRDGRLPVGISWRGGHVSQGERRSTRLEDWGGILGVAGACFVNLQYGDVAAELAAAAERSGVRIHHWPESDPLSDMDDFAAQLAALDLVISVDNSTVHLAGALGVETWLLQPPVPDWRWQEHREDSDWYPALRQLHPDPPGGTAGMLAGVRERLVQRLTDPRD